MPMKHTLRYVLEDGTEIETTYDGRDLREYEKKYNKTTLNVAHNLSMLTFFGWSSAKRNGLINGQYDKYEAFDAVCVDVLPARKAEESDEEPDPTEPAPDTPREASDG